MPTLPHRRSGEIAELGLEECLARGALLVEWPERVLALAGRAADVALWAYRAGDRRSGAGHPDRHGPMGRLSRARGGIERTA